MKDRLIDRVSGEDWNNLSTDMEKLVASKVAKKINGYIDQIKKSGNIEVLSPKE